MINWSGQLTANYVLFLIRDRLGLLLDLLVFLTFYFVQHIHLQIFYNKLRDDTSSLEINYYPSFNFLRVIRLLLCLLGHFIFWL